MFNNAQILIIGPMIIIKRLLIFTIFGASTVSSIFSGTPIGGKSGNFNSNASGLLLSCNSNVKLDFSASLDAFNSEEV